MPAVEGIPASTMLELMHRLERLAELEGLRLMPEVYPSPSSTISDINSKAEEADVLKHDGSRSLSADWDAGSYQITAKTFKSDVATGTAPLTVASETVVPNLNADQVDGKDSTDLVLVDGSQELSADWDIGNGRMIQADKIRARNGDGLALYEDGGAGIFIADGGAIGMGGIVAPAKQLEILDAAAAQVRLTQTAASKYTDFQTDSNGYLVVSPSGSVTRVPASNYLNFGASGGVSGYGFRDNSGVMEFKNTGGAWQNFSAIPGGSSTLKSVLNYGATGDGTTDDTTAIQAAISACSAGDVLYFPSGNYYISGELDITVNLTIMGDGPASQIYQSSTSLNLFHCTCIGQVYIENIKLASEATTAGKCLIRLDSPCSHAVIKNIFMAGGYYGIGFYGGGIFGLLEHICNTTSFYREVSATNQCWVYGERQAPRSNNAFILLHLILQGGTAGVSFDDDASEGSMTIVGGCYESFTTGPAIYIEGYVLGVTNTGIHNEGGADTKLELADCRNVSLAGSFVQSLTMTGCRNITVQNCHLWGTVTSVVIDDTSSDVTLLDSWYTGKLDITAKHVFKSGLTKVLAPAYRGYGMFMGRSGFSNLVDGLFEVWDDDGNPLGFYAAPAGSLEKETSIFRFGTAAAKIIVQAGETKAYLMYAMDAAKYDRSKTNFPNIFTVSFWAWKPTGTGFDPFVKLSYDGGTTNYDTFTLDDEDWMYCQVSIELAGAEGYDNPILQIGVASGVSEGDYIIIDGLTVVEGDLAPLTFDDSRGIEGNFRVSGNSLRGGEVSTMTGDSTFTYGDGELHLLDPGGDDRNYNPSGAFPALAEAWVINTADDAETITFDSDGIAEDVAQNERGYFLYSGSAWIKVYVGS